MNAASANHSATLVANIVMAIRERFRAAAVQRARRIALGELLLMDAARLDDLGIDPQDVMDVLNAPPAAGRRLAHRRSVRVDAVLARA